MRAIGVEVGARQRSRLIVWFVVAAAIGVGVWRVPGTYRSSQQAVDAVHGLSRTERMLLPARTYDISTDIFLAAAQEMQDGATFAVVTGNGVSVSSPLVLEKVPIFAAYWLLPRRKTSGLSGAKWILSYGGNLNTLGLDYKRVVDVAPGEQLAKVKRSHN